MADVPVIMINGVPLLLSETPRPVTPQLGGRRQVPPHLRSWVAKVKQIQQSRGVSYKTALKLASKM